MHKVWRKLERESDFVIMENNGASENGGESTEDDNASIEDSCTITEEDNLDRKLEHMDYKSVPIWKKWRLEWSKPFGDRSHYLTQYTFDLTSLGCSGQLSSKDECATAPKPSAFVDITLQVHTITLTFPLDGLI